MTLVTRLLVGLLGAAIGAGVGLLIGPPKSMSGTLASVYIGAALGLMAGLGMNPPYLARLPYAFGGAAIGGVLGLIGSRVFDTPMGMKLSVLVAAAIGFSVGAVKRVAPRDDFHNQA
jgi:hypothetical protein